MEDENTLHTFIDCLECEMDPEKSYKRLYRRLDHMKPRKLAKYMNYMGKELKKKMEMRLMDFQVLELFLVFYSKKHEFYIKDKKFNRKLQKSLTQFVKNMKFGQAKKKRPQRTFPETQKDRDLSNIKEIKRIKAEKDAEKRRQKRQQLEE